MHLSLILLLILSLNACLISPEIIEDTARTTGDSPDAVQISQKQNFTFSNFISSVYQAPTAEKQALVDSFMQWADNTTGIPYIEDSTAYFLYLNGSNPTVFVAGDFTDWNPSGQQLSQLSGTNLYYRGYSFETDARLDYKLVVNNNWILDPLNPHRTSGGFGANSELAMPAYEQPPEILSYDIPHGSISATTFSDTTLNRTHQVQIYIPPGYATSDQSYRTIYFHDGGEYLSLGSTDNILDYLIHENIIPPVIGVFVDPTDRMDEYAYNIEYMDMFVKGLVPWIDSQYRTFDAAESRAVVGVSLGGLTSLLFTLHHPEIFANCGAYSPAVQIGNIIAQYESSPVLPVKIYMDAGTYETTIYNASSSLERVLAADVWDYQWKSWHEGHSWGAWRAHLDESLNYFWPLHTTGIDNRDYQSGGE